MRAHGFYTLLTLATIGLAGCAVEATEADRTDTNEAALGIADRPIGAYADEDRGVGGRGGVTLAGDETRRMYDFDKTPRIGQRNPYEVNLTTLENALIVPHGAKLEGTEIRRHPATDCGVTCGAP